MAEDTKSVVERAYSAWRARDLANLLSLYSDDVVFALHIPADVMPIGGETRGKVAVGAALQGLIDGYDLLAYEPGVVHVNNAAANAEVHFRYRHRQTGDVIDSRMRHQWLVNDGKVQRLDEWHDLTTVREFVSRVTLRLAARKTE